MKSQLTRALVAAAAVATLGMWVGAGQARADGRGPYDQDSGQWYAGEQRRQEALGYDAYGTGRVGGFLPSYGGYRYALPGAGYYFGAPTYGTMPPANYSYGAYSRPDNTARLHVIVPADAKVWFGSAATQLTGAVRRFESPQLAPGKDYTYDLKATWSENGKEVTRTRHVDVRANANLTVDFTQPTSPK
jgi:uncharacterized protein (TIGR03000 family)